MSNVLIGIIGVILFIGLALAGALFLGPRFQEATQSSRASAAVQAVSQISNAVQLRNLNTGTKMTGSTVDMDALTTDGWLKSIPVNPVVSANIPFFINQTTGMRSGNNPAELVLMSLGNDADGVCTAIARQTNQDPSATTSPTTFHTNPSVYPTSTGCFRAQTRTPVGLAVTIGEYYVFARI